MDTFSEVLDLPVAVVLKYEAPPSVVRTPPAIVTTLKPFYEEKSTRKGRPRKLYTTEPYAEVRKVFADQFLQNNDAQIKTGLGDDYDEVMGRLRRHTIESICILITRCQ